MNNSYKTNNFIYAAFFARKIISLVEVTYYLLFINNIELIIFDEVRCFLKNLKTSLNFRIKGLKCIYHKI